MILKIKEKYHHLSLKLNNLHTSAKTWWSILKSFYNDIKAPLIPPLLVNNKIVSILQRWQIFLMISLLFNVHL